MRLIDADKLEADMTEKVFCGDETYKIFGVSMHQIKSMPTIAPPQNDPLTIEELREMDGEPAYFVNIAAPDYSFWGIVMVDNIFGVQKISGEGKTFHVYQQFLTEQFYGKVWLAYRRKPEEGMSYE